MARTTYDTANTLDGFLADPNHSLDWLLRQDHDPAGPFGFEEYLGNVGAAVVG